MIQIPSGTYSIGATQQRGFIVDKEVAQATIQLNEFMINPYTVTNQEFLEFVTQTGYVTDAENIGTSFVFHLLAEKIDSPESSLDALPWWLDMQGANWKHPFGPNSSIDEIMDHPVVHVSHNDAVAYCRWSGNRLPTEAEWEIAAKGGTTNEVFPWGDDVSSEEMYRYCNTWQGKFPIENDALDGYIGTAPVHTYSPNGYGLYQMIGNVWEWCCNPGKIDLKQFEIKTGEMFWNQITEPSNQLFALKGGSFLCHDSYCKRYRLSARNSNHALTSASNIGFRCVKICE